MPSTLEMMAMVILEEKAPDPRRDAATGSDADVESLPAASSNWRTT